MIERQTSDGIVTLRLAHGKASALDVELCEGITAALRESLQARAVILTGTGSIFSAGVDLFRMTGEGAPYVDRFFPALRDTFEELYRFPRPVVAAVNGHAIAGGCLMAAACDYRLMSGGKIGVPELLVGVPFPSIAIDILQHATGRHAQQLAYSGATIAPAEAREKGLIDEVVEPDKLVARAEEVARQLAAIPAESFRLTKLQLRRVAVDPDPAAVAVWSDPAIHAHIRDYLAHTVGRK
jgi:enoyl-CoA hydratase/carnithine racemase